MFFAHHCLPGAVSVYLAGTGLRRRAAASSPARGGALNNIAHYRLPGAARGGTLNVPRT